MDEDLKKLLYDWFYRVADTEPTKKEGRENPYLPRWSLQRITAYEPYRTQAIADAEIYWALPRILGFGMELFFPESVEIVPFQHWTQTIYRVPFQFGYGMRMEGDDWEKYDSTVERVGIENGEWKIIEVFDESNRRMLSHAVQTLRTKSRRIGK